MLGLIQGLIGPADQLSKILAVLGEKSHPDTGRQRQFNRVIRGGENPHNPIRRLHHRFTSGITQEDKELIASDARRNIRTADRFGQSLGNFLQDMVTHLMPQLVIHLFKPVQVDGENCKLSLLPPGQIKLMRRQLLKQSSISQPGQCIMLCQKLHFLHQRSGLDNRIADSIRFLE